MAHTHDLEWEVGSKRIICMYDGCDFVMEEKDIIAIIGNHAAQQCVQADVPYVPVKHPFACPECGRIGQVICDNTAHR